MKRFLSILLVLMLLVGSAIAESAAGQEVRTFTEDELAYDTYLDIAYVFDYGVKYLEELGRLWNLTFEYDSINSVRKLSYAELFHDNNSSDKLANIILLFTTKYNYGYSTDELNGWLFKSNNFSISEKTDIVWIALGLEEEAKYLQSKETLKGYLDSAMDKIRTLMKTNRDYPFLEDIQTCYKDAVLLYDYIAEFNDNYTNFVTKKDSFVKSQTSWKIDFEFIFDPADYPHVIELREESENERLGDIFQQATKLENAGDYAGALELYWDSYPYEGSSGAIDRCNEALRKIQEDEHKKKLTEFAKVVGNENKIAAGSTHTLGVKENGEVLATGSNEGNRSNVKSWSNIISIATGGNHTIGLRKDGTVVAVGYNDDGMCNVKSWKNIKNVAAGAFHSVGLKDDGTVVAVGHNKYGQCNVKKWTDIAHVAAGTWHTIGLKTDGTVVATGWNDDGQCKVSNWSEIVAIGGGLRHSVGLKSDGTVVAIGQNEYGQCDVSDWTDIVFISAGDYHTVGIKADGTVVATGKNDVGQLNVEKWEDIIAVSCSGFTTIGLKIDGTVVATGSSLSGQGDVKSWDLWD